MDEATLLREAMGCPRSRSSQQVDLVDDECSTDSGCSSGGSTGSAEVLSRRGSAERHCLMHYVDRPRGRSSSGQERLKQRKLPIMGQEKPKSSRSWSPEEKARYRSSSGVKSPSHSQSPSDAQSSDSDSFKRSATTRGLRKAFQSLKISTRMQESDKSRAKSNQKRILRSPVAYTYVKGLSGLPTQRIPRNAV